ncbi:hypothetical protein [Aestuariivivens insulae]|uniref:hypothetical protein n=1 Tax=Aestuariivivens insulae TaxID=1621988 RepID=UPI001F565D5E|nr:hypothetical protein [Aestuariivivens insulae]
MKKIILTCLLLIGFTITGQAQSEKLKASATEKVEELNVQIIKGDPLAALTKTQKEEILNIHIERIKETRKVRKEGGSKEDLKAVNKKYFKKIFSEVLTKQQRAANKAGKEK